MRRIAVIAVFLALVIVLGAAFSKLGRLERSLVAAGRDQSFTYGDSPQKTFAGITKPANLVSTSVKPVRVQTLGPEHYLVDFGRTAFGALQFSTPGRSDQSVDVVLGERRTATGVWHQTPAEKPSRIGAAYIVRRLQPFSGRTQFRVSGPPRQWPRPESLPDGLTSVFPFRYAEITGAGLDIATIRQIAVHYPFDDTESGFSSSSHDLNRVWELSRYSIEATSYAGIYVDGNRERTPYEADAYIDQLSHYNLDRDYRLARHTLEFLLKNPTWPTEWMMFPILSAYADYMYTGDLDYLRSIYPQLKSHALLSLRREDGLVTTDDPARMQSAAALLGLKAPLRNIVDWPERERDGYAVKPVASSLFLKYSVRALAYGTMSGLARFFHFPYAAAYYSDMATADAAARYELVGVNTVVNSFHYAVLLRMAEFARALGYEGDARAYAKQAAATRKAIQDRLFDPGLGAYFDGEGTTHHSMHASMFALAFGLAPKGQVDRIARFVAGRGMAGSVYSAQFLLDSLFANGKADAAYVLLTSHSDRSWIGMMDRTGSTITTEAWNSDVKPDQDWNHAWGASPANIIPRWVLGIRPISPGFSRFIVQPQPGRLSWAAGKVPTIHGSISMRFAFVGRGFHMRVHVPEGTAADVHIPERARRLGKLSLDGAPVQGVGSAEDANTLPPLGPGDHDVVVGADIQAR